MCNIVVTSGITRRILFQICYDIFNSFQFEFQQPVKFAVKRSEKLDHIAEKRSLMNSVNWTFMEWFNGEIPRVFW